MSRLRQWNTASLQLLSAGALAAGAYLAIRLALRLTEVVGNHRIPFTVAFAERTAPVPVGAVDVPVAVTEGIVHAGGLPAGIVVLVAIGELLQAGTPIAVLVMFAILCWRMARGLVFDRLNARLVSVSGAVITGGLLIGAFVAHMGTNYVVAELSGRTTGRIDNPSMFDWVPLSIGIGVMLLGSAFEVGTRMQRDTDGLV
ncbi:hypothetical protein [Pseudolysinimonas sp.]|uniref:hypothetical protein n=1 Tax=Pseudolysinimonas sp. TaxID=2680009 RepID=UPI003F7CF223